MIRNARDVSFPLDDDPLWYRDAIIYQLHVRAFADSNADGIGDFRGIIEKLDYLQDLGVTALWVLPFYPSPLRDDGYDIADYTEVNPIYGTLTDFKVFLREVHRRGLRLITELVLNHTSDKHPWFQRARHAKPGSRWRDFYVWSDNPEKYGDARIIFKDFEPSNWTWDPVAKAYFWHRFYHHQPDLNFDNPDVHKAMFQVLDFWLGQGIDGLRLDAVPYLYEREGTNCENLSETHAFLKELRRHVDSHFKNRMLLAEANQWPEDAVAYFGKGDECHMAFHFPVMPRLFMAIRMEDRFPIIDILQQTPPLPENGQWATFLRNHDELTLEMVTDEDRDYMYRVYAQDAQARINLGIRRRLAPLLANDLAKIALMNGLLFSLPGTPVIYYGDEIGMGDNIYLGDRNGVRTPMQWSAERNAGFSRANPQRLYLPVIIDPEYHYEFLNVEMQQNTAHSLLWKMKHLISLRKRFRAFGRGSLEFLYPDNSKVLAFVRRFQEECVLVVANLSRFVQYVELDLSAFKGMTPVESLGGTKFPPIGEHPYLLTLGSYAIYWFVLQPQRVAALSVPTEEVPMRALTVFGKWDAVFQGKALHALEDTLKAHLETRHWFVRRAGQIEAATIQENIPFHWEKAVAHLVVMRIEFTESIADTYLVPLTFAAGEQVEQIQSKFPHAVVARLQVKHHEQGGDKSEVGLLYDPTGEKDFSIAILHSIARFRRFKGASGEVRAWAAPAFHELRTLVDSSLEPTLVKTEQSNTSVFYGDRLILKVLRRVEEGVHPELEMESFLSDKTSFARVPPLAGALEYHPHRGEPFTLAILQGFLANQGDGWHYTCDALGRYFDQALSQKSNVGELPLPGAHLLDLAAGEFPPLAQEVIGHYLESARLMGECTADLHVALASDPNDSNFAPEPYTLMYQRSLYQSFHTQVRQAIDLLRKRLASLDEGARKNGQEVLRREEEFLRRGRYFIDKRIPAKRIRCHGNYHLGQLLYTGKDFAIIDLEGEVTRSLSDRRRKRSPLRDVVSMIRSFHAAALSVLGKLRPEDVPNLEPWARFWHLWVAVAFLKAYLQKSGPAALLPMNLDERKILLDFHLLRRTFFELRSDLLEHPDRVKVPLQGLLQLLEEAKPTPTPGVASPVT